MTIALDKKWIWDSWYVQDAGLWHGFFLQADKTLIDPDLRHLNVTQGHATSTDLVNWTHLGTTFGPQRDGAAWDDSTTWTGSVVRGDDNLWHLFYTGTRLSENSLYQCTTGPASATASASTLPALPQRTTKKSMSSATGMIGQCATHG
jgi:beta-fructofuranosidase